MKSVVRVALLILTLGFVVVIGMMPTLQPRDPREQSEVNQAMPETRVLE